MKNTYDDVFDSYHRCEASGELFDSFYEIFFAKSAEVPPKFADTDMRRQKQDVMASVLMALRFATGDAVARQYVQQLGESHSRRRRDIRPQLYDLWIDALCEAIKKHDPKYTPELEQQWRQAMRPAIELMISEY